MAAQQDSRPSAWEEKQQQIQREHDEAMARGAEKQAARDKELDVERETRRALYVAAGGSEYEFDHMVWPQMKRDLLSERVAAQLRASSVRNFW